MTSLGIFTPLVVVIAAIMLLIWKTQRAKIKPAEHLAPTLSGIFGVLSARVVRYQGRPGAISGARMSIPVPPCLLAPPDKCLVLGRRGRVSAFPTPSDTAGRRPILPTLKGDRVRAP